MKDPDENLSGGEREPGVRGCPGNQEAFFQEDSIKCPIIIKSDKK